MKTPHRVRTRISVLLRWRLVGVGIVLGVLCSAPSLAQTPDTASRIYKLAKSSTFQKGCFPPCLCPVVQNGTEQGTFVLTADGFDGLFDKYVITEVNWNVTTPNGDLRVTGSGTYRVGGEFAVQQQLSLDLKVGDDSVQHFDSGLVAGGGDFPRIVITISIHGQVCFDTVFSLDASPVPPSDIHAYRLLNESTFQQGCTGPCACASGAPQRLRGTFSLVELDRDPLFTRYAVARANWRAGGDNGTGSSGLPVTGSGFYRIGGEVAIEQQMSLELKVGSQFPANFDSGLVPGGGAFPRIDIDVTSTEGNCVTTAIDLHAAPARSKSTEVPTLQQLSP